jgi:hypothetical protein
MAACYKRTRAMFERQIVHRVLLRLIALVVLVCPPASAASKPSLFLAASGGEPVRLDPITIPPIESGRRVLSVVAADIDGDGDLDVVANDGSLDLIVWVNDGAGHLTRQSAGRWRSWRPSTPGPRVSDSGRASLVVTISDPPATSAPVERYCAAPESRRLRTTRGADAPTETSPSNRIPRAPPLLLSRR